MKNVGVKIGGKYYANVSGSRTETQIDSEKANGGWNAINLATGKKILVKSAQRLLGTVGARKGRTKTSTEATAELVDAFEFAELPLQLVRTSTFHSPPNRSTFKVVERFSLGGDGFPKLSSCSA